MAKTSRKEIKMEQDELIPLSKVPWTLLEYFGEKRSRMTVYYWARVGVNGTKLKTTKRVGRLYTTYKDLEDFVGRM